MMKRYHRKFAMRFPSYHPRATESTFFVEKIVKGFAELKHPIEDIDVQAVSGEINDEVYESTKPKWHTIRAGHWFKDGDLLIPEVWTGRPYHSQVVRIAEPIKVKTWNFQTANGAFCLNERWFDGEVEGHHELLELIAENDGLSKTDFVDWFHGFKKPFDGQIICWNETINYLN